MQCLWGYGIYGYNYINEFDYQLLSFLFILGVFMIIAGITLYFKVYRKPIQTSQESVIEIVKLRYVKGEISLEEYLSIIETLKRP